MAFEEVLEEAGGFGLYQKLLVYVFLPLAMMNSGLTYWTQIMIMFTPKHHCAAPLRPWLNDSQATLVLNGSLDTLSAVQLGTCEITLNGTNDSIPCPNGWEYDFADLFPTLPAEHDWVCKESVKPYAIHTSFWAGSVFGFFITGIISDRFGRRASMLILEGTMALMNVLTIFMTHHWAFCIVRFLLGTTVLTTSTLAFLMSIEYVEVKKRTFIGTLQGVYWSLMAAGSPWIVYGVRNWRGLLGLCCLPTLLLLVLLWWVPESASWLLTRGRRNHAVSILEHIAHVNGIPRPEGYFAKQLTKQGLSNFEKPSSKEIIESVVSVAKTPYLRKNIALLLIMWIGVSMCYNGITIEMGNLDVNLFVAYSIGAIVELGSNMYFWAAGSNLGRRWANFVMSIVGSLAALVLVFIPDGMSLAETVITLLGRLAWAASYDVTLQYSAELLPTAIRGRGVSIQLMVGDLGNCIAPFVVYLTVYNRHYPVLVFGAISTVSAVLALLLPETATEPLPQTIQDGRTFGKSQSFWWTCPRLVSRRRKRTLQQQTLSKDFSNHVDQNGVPATGTKSSDKAASERNGHTNIAVIQFLEETSRL